MNFTSAKLGGLVLALLMVLGGCGNGQPSSAPTGTIPEATFVAAMAELHHALGSALDGELSQATQDEILARHGIKAEDLLAFAEVHGTDIPTMLRIWQDVARESRLLDAPDAADDSGMLP